MRFKKLTAEYLDSLLELENLSFSIPWSRNMFLEELNNEKAHYYMLIEDNKVLAYAGLWIVLDEAQITNIAVHPEYRRKGLAKYLLNNLFKETDPMQKLSFTLEVRESNIEAINLYLSFGFVNYGVRKGYYADNGENAIIMWKNHT